jgi:hypothetical protein
MTKMTLNSSQLVAYIFTIIIGVSLLSTIIPGIQYFKYALPLVAIFIYFIIEKKSYLVRPNNLNLALLLYIIWGALGFIVSDSPHLIYGSKDLFFVTAYLIPFCLYTNKDTDLVIVFYIYSAFFLLSTLGMDAATFSLADSTAPFEGAACFVFGMFALYFSMEKKYKEMAFTMILMLLTMKRIALLAFLLCQLVWLAPLLLQKKVLNRIFFLLVNSIFVCLIILIGGGWVDDLILEITGKGVNFFTLGRFNIYMGVVDEIIRSPLNLIIGNGVGSSYPLTIINTTDLLSFNNLHSDSLKLFYEHGIIFFTLFFLLASKLQNIKSKIILLYVCILFITDNVLIYVSVMFFTLLIISFYEANLKNTN